MLLLTSVMCFVPFDFSCHHVILVRMSVFIGAVDSEWYPG